MAGIKGQLPADEWAKIKAGLLSDVFSLERNMQAGNDTQVHLRGKRRTNQWGGLSASAK